MSLKVKGQSTTKAENDRFENNISRINEDAFIIRPNRIAIADGAGGTGIVTNKWAQKLVENIPPKPIISAAALNHWIEDFWEDFYQENIEAVRNDPWQLNKFESEGSGATLAAIWQVSDNVFDYISYGDSALFIYDKRQGTLQVQENLKSINSFTTTPPLINWNSEQIDVNHFYREKFSLSANQAAILTTDGLGMFLHGAYLSLSNQVNEDILSVKMRNIVNFFQRNQEVKFDDLMQAAYESLNSNETFSRLMKGWHETKFLPNDDYTLIWLERG